MNINLGCGDRYVDGWVNVDLPDMPHRVDQRVDITSELPWRENSIDCVYAGHVLEHLHKDDAYQLVARLLPLMKPYGAIMLVGPDVEVAAQLFNNVPNAPDQFGVTLDALRYGAGRWCGDVHLWECTVHVLEDMLNRAGWDSVTPMNMDEVAVNWPVADPRPKWQCAVGAIAYGREKLHGESGRHAGG